MKKSTCSTGCAKSVVISGRGLPTARTFMSAVTHCAWPRMSNARWSMSSPSTACAARTRRLLSLRSSKEPGATGRTFIERPMIPVLPHSQAVNAGFQWGRRSHGEAGLWHNSVALRSRTKGFSYFPRLVAPKQNNLLLNGSSSRTRSPFYDRSTDPRCRPACCNRPDGVRQIMGIIPTIPKTAPFGDEEIALLNRVVGPASTTQRAWLAGFLAGLESAAGGAAQPAAPAHPAEPVTILYASESGNCERLANDFAKTARKNGLKPTLVDMADLDLSTLPGVKRLVVIAATWGEGDPPARAVRAFGELMSDNAPSLDGVEFGVLALGDTAYVEFCAIGKKIDERLEKLGAKRLVNRIDCDLDFAEPAGRWIADAVKTFAPADAASSKVIEVDFTKPTTSPNLDIVEAEITEHINLNSSSSDKETIHLALSFDGVAPAYEPGDSLDVYAENDPAYVDELLKLSGLSGDDKLRGELTRSRDVTTLSLKTIETYAAQTGHQYVKALIADGQAREWIVGRQLIDLIATFPIALTAEHLRAVTRTLAPRAYSIASSRREVGEEAHLLVSAVRYETHGRARKGVASNFM